MKTLKELYEAKRIAASPEYMRKEEIREGLQNLIIEALEKLPPNAAQADLEHVFSDIDTAMTALRMIPMDAWVKLMARARA